MANLIRGLQRLALPAASGLAEGRFRRSEIDREENRYRQLGEREDRDYGLRRQAHEADEEERQYTRGRNEVRDREAAENTRADNVRQDLRAELDRQALMSRLGFDPGPMDKARLEKLQAEVDRLSMGNERISRGEPANPPAPRAPVRIPFSETRRREAIQYRDSLIRQGLSDDEANKRARVRFPDVNLGQTNDLLDTLLKLNTGRGGGGTPPPQ